MRVSHQAVRSVVSWSLALVTCLLGSMAPAQGSSVLFGTVIDSTTKQPVPDVVVTARSPRLQGEQVAVTDEAGLYRISQLPSGQYTLRFDKEAYRPFSRDDVTLRLGYSVRVNVELLPDSALSEEILVVGHAPTIDVGSTSTGVNVSGEFLRDIVVIAPGGKNGAARSFESLAELAPGATTDPYGTSISGATSPENQYLIDGISVNDPSTGVNGTPLSIEFIQEVNVLTGGYLPEYGRATGGVVDVVTKSGSNEFHGSVFGNYTPGALATGGREIRQEVGAISGQESLWNLGDFGVELGGPLLRDKLWFYVGIAPSFTRYQLERNLNVRELDENGLPILNEDGTTRTRRIEGTQQSFFADQRGLQYIGKLTYLAGQNHTVTFSVLGTPGSSGGPGRFSFLSDNGAPEVSVIQGMPEALSTQRFRNSLDVGLKSASSFFNKHLLLDVTLGWHHQESAIRASDGTRAGSREGLSDISQVSWQRFLPYEHSILDFESLPEPSVCGTTPEEAALLCPAFGYISGGPGFLDERTLDRYQGRLTGTLLVKAAGQHVLKAGLDAEWTRYDHLRAMSGGSQLFESAEGDYFEDAIQYGRLLGPDQVNLLDSYRALSRSRTLGGFVQDSWNVLDLVTFNLGLRYDVQWFQGQDQRELVLANQWSPRLGLIVDPTRAGRSRLFASYARYFENIPLNLIDNTFPIEPRVLSRKSAEVCDPLAPGAREACSADRARLPYQVETSPLDPSRLWRAEGGSSPLVDPDIQAQSTDEWIAGGEYELIPHLRVGISYTRRSLNRIVESMSRDGARTYFIGNPGYGLGQDFEKATRTYDAGTLFLQRTFAEQWLLQASYTLSSLRGNYEGLFRTESNELNPNNNTDFDSPALSINREGPLPADRTHQLRVFAAREFIFGPDLGLQLGLSYFGSSGAPYNHLGADEVFGPGQIYILPRGSAGRLPWFHRIDTRLAVTYRLSKTLLASAGVEVFNLFNFQAAIAYDENYTFSVVRPIPNGTREQLTELRGPDGEPLDPRALNANFGQPIAYQLPRSIRLSARLSF
ncbi:TonB-dependent receptor [Archangium violaceum]|uniref:TonB-dependent receptor n=1 Tax=Archangium violaceum Cb vi76 TaxID=1406225 RepID=A0A084SIB4_9BACT|nr:TonB-dependent receptor [Archangium violaceum]KFA88199.1 TonB-dependent receptor [Archangium violaceum Cb vi76]